MSKSLTRAEVRELVAETAASFAHNECRCCDCFQGFLTQLELDAFEDVSDILLPYRVEKSDMHGCLGCEPCPSGAAFSEYLKSRRNT